MFFNTFVPGLCTAISQYSTQPLSQKRQACTEGAAQSQQKLEEWNFRGFSKHSCGMWCKQTNIFRYGQLAKRAAFQWRGAAYCNRQSDGGTAVPLRSVSLRRLLLLERHWQKSTASFGSTSVASLAFNLASTKSAFSLYLNVITKNKQHTHTKEREARTLQHAYLPSICVPL